MARGRKIKIVARSNQTVENLIGRRSKEPPKLGCPALNHILRGVRALRQGRQIAALAAARTAIDVAVFGHEGVSDDELGQANIAPDSWKALGVRCLLSVNGLNIAGSVFDWQVAAGKILAEELSSFDLNPVREIRTDKLKPKRQGEWEKPLSEFLPRTGVGDPPLAGIPVQTVHSVKGETHDVTIFVCPDPAGAGRSLSSVWWSDNEKDREERRIAYVAMTRTQRDLILCVPEKTYQQLCTQQPQFVASFECVLAEDFAEIYRRGLSAGSTVFTTLETVGSTG